MDNAVQPAPAPIRLWSIDALRGVCAGIVFLSHWHLWSDFAPRGSFEQALRAVAEFCHDTVAALTWPTGGHHPAVIGFFVLSGFCIHYPFERRRAIGGAEPPWREYFARRARRILPVYWAACLLGFAFVAAEKLAPSGSALLTLHATCSVADVLVRLSGLASLYPAEVLAGNYTLTTVTTEIVMYAVYPLFHAAAVRGSWGQLGALFLALHALAIALLQFFTPFWVFNSIFMLGIFWFAGAFAARLYVTRRPRISGRWLVLAWAAFLAIKSLPHFVGLNLLKQLAWGVVCAVGILWSLRWESARPGAGEGKIVRWLRRTGTVSYSLYAMHTPAVMLASWALIHLGWRDYLVQLAATLAASLGATLAVHYALERKFYQPAATPARPAAPTVVTVNEAESALR